MRRLGKWIVGGVLAAAALTVAGGGFLLSVALRPTVERDAEHCYRDFCGAYPALRPWADSLRAAGALRDTTIAAGDGTRLQAFFIGAPAPAKRTADMYPQ